MLASESIVVRAPVREVFRILADPLLCLGADIRISTMRILRQNGDEMLASVRGYVVYPILESTVLCHIRLEPDRGIEVVSQADTISLPGRLAIRQFRGYCQLEPTAIGTRIVRTESYATRNNWLGRLVEGRGEAWLRRHLADITLPRLKQLVEASETLA